MPSQIRGTSSEQRVVMGDPDGSPITALVRDAAAMPLRWRANGASFVLEYCCDDGHWREVPCVPPKRDWKDEKRSHRSSHNE